MSNFPKFEIQDYISMEIGTKMVLLGIIIGCFTVIVIMTKAIFFPNVASFQSDIVALTVIQTVLIILWILTCGRMIGNELVIEFIDSHV